MWNIVRNLRESGVTIILTTHYIEEAEEIADRIGVVNKGELLLVEDKQTLMQRLGKKQLIIELRSATTSIPQSLLDYQLELSTDGKKLTYTFDTQGDSTGITALLQTIQEAGLSLNDLEIKQSSLEDIFVNLVREKA
jgi:ABC-2 type transport system ATP-binding protein